MPKKIIDKFKKQYGKERGESVYYATMHAQGRDPHTAKKKGKKTKKEWLEVNVDTEVILDDQKYLLEKGDKILVVTEDNQS